jgi:hypothetical protein
MDFFIPFLILLATVFIGRLVNEKSYKLLTVDQKSLLIDLFSNYRIFGFLFIIVVIAGLFLFPYFNILNSYYTMIMYVACFVAYFIGMGFFAYRKLKQDNFPGDFIRLYLLSLLIRFVGISVFFVIVFYQEKIMG